MMTKFQYRIRPEIATVLSNRVSIPYFSYGDYFDQYAEDSPSLINIAFSIENDISKPAHLKQKFHFCYGADNAEEVYLERPLGLGLTAKLHCRNLMTHPEIKVNKTYARFIKSKIDNIFPPGVHLADTLSIHLLANSYVPLHCAAISANNEGIILAAPPDTGKSVTTMLAVKRGFGFLSEDIAIADENNIYSNPHTATFYHTPGFKDKSLRQMIFSAVSTHIPGLSYVISPPAARIYDIFKEIKIDVQVPIKHIFILDRGDQVLEEIESSEALRRILIINRNEFSYHKNTLLFAYSYFNRSLDIETLKQQEEKLIAALTKKVKCHIVRSPDPTVFIDQITKVIS